VDAVISKYINDGVFYVKIQNNVWDFSKEIQDKINSRNSVDVLFSNGCITATRGHPIMLYNQLYKWQYSDYVPNPDWFENKAYYTVDSKEDLKNKWPIILSKKPDFIKIMLSYTEDRVENLKNPSPYARIGLDPKIAKLVVEIAHKNGLSVSAHVETNVDFHLAVEIGVDEISHLPGYYIHTEDKQSIAPVSKQDVLEAKEKGIDVVTTTVLSRTVLRDKSLLPIVQKYQKQNLELLKRYGINLLIGSDHSDTSVDELFYLKGLHVFSNLELLKMICEATPKAMFPERKIGEFKEGYEASFILVAGNPIVNLAEVNRIKLRVKEGMLLPGL
jgi:hypothetical protein